MTAQLHSAGVRVVVDDFGTGYSSTSLLQSVSASVLKIERNFVAQMSDGDSGAETIVRSIVDLGHSLGLEVAADGVQHAEALEQLRRLGVTYAQGGAVARPMTGEQLDEWLPRRALQR